MKGWLVGLDLLRHEISRCVVFVLVGCIDVVFHQFLKLTLCYLLRFEISVDAQSYSLQFTLRWVNDGEYMNFLGVLEHRRHGWWCCNCVLALFGLMLVELEAAGSLLGSVVGRICMTLLQKKHGTAPRKWSTDLPTIHIELVLFADTAQHRFRVH